MSSEICTHFGEINHELTLETPDTAEGCFECLKIGSEWVNLRQCLTDGKIGCCDSSPNQHATKHYQESSHPVIHLIENNIAWCFVDEIGKKQPY
ncbi:MAG: UBP-type zinc finger domain-containing protein [Candidatus Heimdallarchaeota archaeon]|nr:UBP-type zinc finger domain-containing protein [Candidatus Heimdallarchaeota archaeon]